MSYTLICSGCGEGPLASVRKPRGRRTRTPVDLSGPPLSAVLKPLLVEHDPRLHLRVVLDEWACSDTELEFEAWLMETEQMTPTIQSLFETEEGEGPSTQPDAAAEE